MTLRTLRWWKIHVEFNLAVGFAIGVERCRWRSYGMYGIAWGGQPGIVRYTLNNWTEGQ